MGANNWSIRKVFLIQASYLIGRGLIIGNVIRLDPFDPIKYWNTVDLSDGIDTSEYTNCKNKSYQDN